MSNIHYIGIISIVIGIIIRCAKIFVQCNKCFEKYFVILIGIQNKCT